jgi:DNA-binding LacI/PurR family transcriptional regulator/signal transduction histidine kinase
MGTGKMAFASKASPNPRRIGVFIGSLDDSFQKAIWKSVADCAAKEGVEIAAFFGQGLGSPIPAHATMNIVYKLAGPENLDALIVISSTVGNFRQPDDIARLVEALGLPAVSIQYGLDGRPSVSTRGGSAMRDLVRHLAREHGRRSFALITGPRRHPDSIEREKAFRETLAREGIAFDEQLLYEGSFYKDSGAKAVESFIASGRSFDALVGFNDAMALGAMDELKSRGIAVPGDVAVTGFDDIEEARWSSPPLTTVRQPIAEIGRISLELAIGLLDGASPPSVSLECRFSPRRSCGCPPILPLSSPMREEGRLATGSEGRIAEALSALADSGDILAMLKLLDARLVEEADSPDAFASLRIVLYELRSSRGEGGRAEEIGWFDQAIAYLGEAERRREIGRSIKAAERYSLVRDLGTQLLETFSLDTLVRQWETCVKRLGLGPSFLVLFEGPVEPRGTRVPESSILVTSAPGSPTGIERRTFPTTRLFPPGIGDRPGRVGWIVEPLVYQTEALGYLLIDSASEESIVYETLREHMSTAVKATLLMEEIEEQKRSLERQVELRTEELSAANRDLEEQIAQRRLLEAEVQEIGNRTMQAIGQDIHDDLCQQLVGISMLAAALEEGMDAPGEAPREALREIRKLLESAIARSRQFARSLYPPGLEELGLVSALEDLSASLGRAGAGLGSGAAISFQAEGDCRVEDPRRALQLYRIMQEALSNAIRHSGSEVILLRLFKKDGGLVAEVRDFGVGLDISRGLGGGLDAGQGRGMGMRIMRYRADSIGARLEIRNLDPGVCVSCALDQKEG